MDSGIEEKKPMGGASKPPASETKTPKKLKIVRKIVKKSQKNNTANAGETKVASISQKKPVKIKSKATAQAQGKTGDSRTKAPESNKDKNVTENEKEKHVDKKIKEKGMIDQKEGDLSKNESGENHKGDNGKGIIVEKSKEENQTDQKNKGKKNKEKSQSVQEDKDKSRVDQKKKEQNQIGHKNNAKLGGLIMMCNAKTKPDCLRYMVMGLPASRQELVMSVKPGLKLFLYDFDLRLLHGIYEAASRGGMKLEPAAFTGAFPAQVRYRVHKDCMPLPESVFKNAIKESYDERRNKFKTELTQQQVRKLSELFQPIILHPNAHSVPIPVHVPPFFHSLPGPIVPLVGLPENRREAPAHAQQAISPGQPYLLNNARRHDVPPQELEREQPPKYSVSKQREFEREQPPKYSTSKQREFEREQPPKHTSKKREFEREQIPEHTPSKRREVEREHPKYTTSKQRDSVSAQREPAPRDPLALSEKEYRTFGLARNRAPPTSVSAPAATNAPLPALDPYRSGRDLYYSYNYSGGTSVSYPQTTLDPYRSDFDLPRRGGFSQEEPTKSTSSHLGHSYGIPRRDEMEYSERFYGNRTDEVDRMYSAHAADPLPDYRRQEYPGGRPEAASLSVSSRYSFAGMSSSSYR